MKDEIRWEMLVRYVAGECSEQEHAAVQAWIAADERHRKQMDTLRQVWTVAKQEENDVNVEAALERLEERISRSLRADRRRTPAQGRPAQGRPARARRRSHSSRRQGFRVAAVLAVVALTGLFSMLVLMEPTPEASTSEATVFATERGQRAVIQLIDGTKVHLNADSRLTLATGFPGDSRRVVQLRGEAYFEVARDTTRPFIVRTEEANIEVLGTRFDVKAYPEEANVRVIVAGGEVAVQPKRPASRDTKIVLKRHHLGVVTKTEVRAVRTGVDVSTYLAWTEGRLVFRDASFREVSRKLERWYGLEVEVTLPPETILELNATFDGESVDEVLGDIALALNLHYEKDGRTVTFYRRAAALHSRAVPQVVSAR